MGRRVPWPTLLASLFLILIGICKDAEVLRDPKLAALLMEADEHPSGSPFDHYTKIQAMISKAKTEEGINYAFTALRLCSNLPDDVKTSLTLKSMRCFR